MSRPTYDEAAERITETNKQAARAGMQGFLKGGALGMIGGALFGLAMGVLTSGISTFGVVFGAVIFGLMGATAGQASSRQAVISYERGREAGLQEAGVELGMAQEKSQARGHSQQQTILPDLTRHTQHAAQLEEARAVQAALDEQLTR